MVSIRFFINKLLLTSYRGAWLIALPILQRNRRMALGWEERVLKVPLTGPVDIWIQASSGGESMLTNMVLSCLAEMLGKDASLKILVTSGTQQGVESLHKGAQNLKATAPGRLDVRVRYFPVDAPAVMNKVFTRLKPKLAVVVETELWPGYLTAAKRASVPVLVINGRMSEKSFANYKYFRCFFENVGPQRVFAISDTDAARFGGVVGEDRVAVINNIKFDRITPRSSFQGDNPLQAIIPWQCPFVLLGSVRREEEGKILEAICSLLASRSDIVIGLFPKHIERADAWISELTEAGVPARKRSETTETTAPGTVLVWDVFGELAGAYSLAQAAFVGGSLVNLGGQNFLEPLFFGLRPVIGPYWKNFAWVGREILSAGLIREVCNEKELVNVLLSDLSVSPSREEIVDKVQYFLKTRQGGTETVCREILLMLEKVEQKSNS